MSTWEGDFNNSHFTSYKKLQLQKLLGGFSSDNICFKWIQTYTFSWIAIVHRIVSSFSTKTDSWVTVKSKMHSYQFDFIEAIKSQRAWQIIDRRVLIGFCLKEKWRKWEGDTTTVSTKCISQFHAFCYSSTLHQATVYFSTITCFHYQHTFVCVCGF